MYKIISSSKKSRRQPSVVKWSLNQWRQLNCLSWRCQQEGEISDRDRVSLFSSQGRLKEAIQILRHSKERHALTSQDYLRLIRSSIRLRLFSEGKEIYKLIVKNGVEASLVLQNNIILLFARCGDIKNAHHLFVSMCEKNLFTWAAMIGAYGNNGYAHQAFELYEKMVVEGIRADRYLFPLVLKSCSNLKSLTGGRKIHVGIIKNGYLFDIVIMNSLIDMYSKCNSLLDAWNLFEELSTKDIYSWTSIIVGFVQARNSNQALIIFKDLLCSDVRPRSDTFAGILPIFSNMGCINLAKQIHGLVVEFGFELDAFVGSALIDMYCNCESLGYARFFFDRMYERDIICWNIMIRGYAQAHLFNEVFELLQRMHLDDVYPNKRTWEYIIPRLLEHGGNDFQNLVAIFENGKRKSRFVSLSSLVDHAENIHQLQIFHKHFQKIGYLSDAAIASSLIDSCSKFGEVEISKHIFNQIDVKEVRVWNSLISCYVKNRRLDDALYMIDSMLDTLEPSVNLWNSLMEGFVKNKRFESVFVLFVKMKWLNKRPNSRTFDVVLPMVGSMKCLIQGKELHNVFLRNGCLMNIHTTTAFINMYGNCDHVDYAFNLFEMAESKDLISWNAIISCFAKNGFLDKALKIFNDMEEFGLKANIISWTSLISGSVHFGQLDQGLKHFRCLQLEGLKPNSICVTSILPACAELGSLSYGKSVHNFIVRHGISDSDLFVTNALLDMYIKCGCLEYSFRMFERLDRRDIVSWNTIINGFALHGKSNFSLSLFDDMLSQGFSPDNVTFFAILSACSHGNMIDEGWKHFNSMYSKYGILPSGKHYSCMVDVLGHGGYFDDIRDFIIQMPLRPIISLWANLLLSSKTHGNVEMAEYAAGHLFELQPDNPGNYLQLLDVYAFAGRWNDVDRVRNMMRDRGIKKLPNFSWIEIGNKIKTFPCKDLNTHEMESVSQALIDLTTVLIEEGYVPERQVTHETD